MKKTYGYIGSVAAILLATHIGSYQLGKHHMGLATKDNQIAYIDDSKGKAKALKQTKRWIKSVLKKASLLNRS